MTQPSNELASLLFAGLAVLGAAVAWSDLRTRRIPNAWLLVGLVYAFAVLTVHTWPGGFGLWWRAVGYGLLGMVLGLGLSWPALYARQLAPGDVKFLMVIGFFLGPIGAVFALLNAALVGGVWALWLSARHGGLRHALANLRYMGRSLYLSGGRTIGWDLRSAGAVRMPYGVALAAGAGLVIAWQLGRHHPALQAVWGAG